MTEEFINYLTYIGFITDDTSPFFISLLNMLREKVEQNEKKQCIIQAMIQYFKSLTYKQLSDIMTNIFERYIENKEKVNNKVLYKLLNIYQNKEIKFYFLFWYKISQYLKNNEMFQLQKRLLNLEKTEIKSTINHRNVLKDNFIFGKGIINISKTNQEMPSYTNKTRYTFLTKNKSFQFENSNFFERQKKYIENKQKKIMKNINNNEEEFQLLYTFKPCLAESSKSSKHYLNNHGYFFSTLNVHSNKNNIENMQKSTNKKKGINFRKNLTNSKSVSTYCTLKKK